MATLLLVLNVIYTHTFYGSDLNAMYPEREQIRNANEYTDIYYFGESSNITHAPGDSVTLSISELAAQFYPGLKVTTVNKYATHAGIFSAWLNEISTEHGKPGAVVVTANLRSFDAAWIHSKLETPLRQSLVMALPYPPLVNRFLLSLQAFDNKSEKQREQDMLEEWRTRRLIFPFPFQYTTVAEWDYATAQGAFLNADSSWNRKKIELACHYIKGYAFNITEDNPRVKDFDRIKSWCGKHDVRLYLNLMAENIEYADSLVGKELVFLMKQNRDYLIKRYQGENCVVVDNLEEVEGKYFIDKDWTTEHYTLQGRMLIARNLADSLKKQYRNNYLKAF